MHVQSYALSDVGRKRPHNEDAFLRDDAHGLYVVADGVGGHAKGEVASAEAVEQIQNFVRGGQATMKAFLENPSEGSLRQVRRLLEGAVQQACYMVFGIASLDPQRKGMSTTISALLVIGNTGVIAQVGDSRVYIMRHGEVLQLTEDHTLVNYRLKHGLITREQAKRATEKNVITRAVGHHDHVEVDTTDVQVVPGDRFLLCSDGLHGYLEEPEEIAPYLKIASLQDSAKQLIAIANHKGGKDNITAVVIDIKE